MSKTLKKLTILVVVSLAVIGGIWGGLSATATAQTAGEDAIKAEVQTALDKWVQAFNTGDGDLFDSVSLQSDKTTWISLLQPFRVDGWNDVRRDVFTGLLSLPPGAVTLVIRQNRIDLLGDDVAIQTGHFIATFRAPAPPLTLNGRSTLVWEKIDGKWLWVSGHTSALP